MAALVAAVPTLPALDEALKAHDFQESRALYNSLKGDDSQPHVAGEHIQNLAALFVRQNAENVFGIHLIHGHFQIPEGTVMVGTNFQSPDMRWAKTTDFDKLEGSSIHGHIFVLTDSGFRAYEFQDGPLPDLADVEQDFLVEFSRYITANNLDGLIGLQVLGGGARNNHGMSELILDHGTVMLDTSLVRNCQPPRMTSGNHKVFNAGKPLPKLENVDDLKAALVEAGVM